MGSIPTRRTMFKSDVEIISWWWLVGLSVIIAFYVSGSGVLGIDDYDL